MNFIEKNNLAEEAYNQILQMIATGEWREGDKLPSENEFCKTFGVSRSTVRAALGRLTALGLVETRQGFGYCVRDLNIGVYLNSMLPTMLLHSKDFESITEFRIGMEGEAAYMAAMRADDEDIEGLRKACEKGEASLEDNDQFAKYDMEFHRMVANASKNPLFIKMAEMLETMYTVWLMGFLRNHGKERSKNFHYSIYRAIAEHDPDRAKQQMEDHLKDVLEKVKKDTERKRQLKNN